MTIMTFQTNQLRFLQIDTSSKIWDITIRKAQWFQQFTNNPSLILIQCINCLWFCSPTTFIDIKSGSFTKESHIFSCIQVVFRFPSNIHHCIYQIIKDILLNMHYIKIMMNQMTLPLWLILKYTPFSLFMRMTIAICCTMWLFNNRWKVNDSMPNLFTD